MQITFQETPLHLIEDAQHEFLLSNKEVALGYGITQSTLRSNTNNHKDELIEGKHWLKLEMQTKGGKQKVIHWTKKGIVRLGFFIKSENAKKFRDWAEDYIVNGPIPSNTKELQEIILKQNALLAGQTSSDELKKLQFENKQLKEILVTFHDKQHQALEQLTNRFQVINSGENGTNLNTKTIAKHKYWK